MNIFYCRAFELGNLVNERKISPSEILDQYEKRINAVNSKVNAVVYTKFDEARKRAKSIEASLSKGEYCGPFAGVPVGLKDFLPSKRGWTASHGGVRSLVTVDEYDSEFCKAAENLGAIVIGKTNSPSFGFRGTCDNSMYGPTSSPFNPKYNSGGSSGGSASAVSAGMLAMAEGGDAGGSIRIPAAWCGCFGFKPSAGLVPSVCRPDAWTATHPYCCGGPITRSVYDAAVMMDEMMRYDPADPISVPLPKKHFLKTLDQPIRGMKIAVTFNFDLFPDPEPAVVKSIELAMSILKDAGVEVSVVKMNFPSSRQEYEDAWLRSISVDGAIDEELGLCTFDHKDVPEQLVEWNKKAFSSNMLDYRKFHELRTEILDAHNEIFKDYDIILAPVTGCLNCLNDYSENLTEGPSEISGQPINPLIGFGYTFLENMIGTPAASVPVMRDEETNLPIGVQVIGKRYFDEDVFKVSYMLEQMNPWIKWYSELDL